jgi:hypothetical protein
MARPTDWQRQQGGELRKEIYANAKRIISILLSDTFGDIELTEGRRKSGFGLLRKVIPDLSTVTLQGDEERPFVHRVEITIVDPKNTDSEGVSAAPSASEV